VLYASLAGTAERHLHRGYSSGGGKGRCLACLRVPPGTRFGAASHPSSRKQALFPLQELYVSASHVAYGRRERRMALRARRGTAGSLPGRRTRAPGRDGLVPLDGIALVGKPSPPSVQINWGRAKRSRVKFGPGGFQSSGLLLLSHFIIMNNKEILTHGFCKLFIARTEKSGQQYVKQTTCMSALI